METFFLSAFSSIERLQIGLDEGMKEYRVNGMAEKCFCNIFYEHLPICHFGHLNSENCMRSKNLFTKIMSHLCAF